MNWYFNDCFRTCDFGWPKYYVIMTSLHSNGQSKDGQIGFGDLKKGSSWDKYLFLLQFLFLNLFAFVRIKSCCLINDVWPIQSEQDGSIMFPKQDDWGNWCVALIAFLAINSAFWLVEVGSAESKFLLWVHFDLVILRYSRGGLR